MLVVLPLFSLSIAEVYTEAHSPYFTFMRGTAARLGTLASAPRSAYRQSVYLIV